jgi:alpha-glucuronidase
MKRLGCIAGLLLVFSLGAARAENGYELWLRYRPIESGAMARPRHDVERGAAIRHLAKGQGSTIARVVDGNGLTRGTFRPPPRSGPIAGS